MKKSLIALAVASAFVAPAAMAEVTLSGAINLGIEIGKTGAGTSSGQSLTHTHLNSNYSQIDRESVDDIGGGNKVLFHYQIQVQTENATALTPLHRDRYAALQGGCRPLQLRPHENVYDRMMYTPDPIEGAHAPGGNLNI